ncbi:RNA-binding protein 48-like [Saccostrea echinata]|uniref:RNA-binding protein 48-like n=1 Tax=Saccostrea echinata TaxID=191078 RepID=UPI002A80D30D|nr:RNA-binding protein 48-like [Saccostrea echinata]
MAAPMKIPSHHIKATVAENRPAYREGRLPKATKVYTVNQESAYLLVQGVPALGTSQELIKLFAVYGAVEEYRVLDEFPSADKYTDVYLVKFQKIQAARFAKRKLDDFSFYGGVIHVSYAPEFESVEETRQKLQDRRRTVASRIRISGKEAVKKNSERNTSSADERDHKDISEFQHTQPVVPESAVLPVHYEAGPQISQLHFQTESDQQITKPEQLYLLPPPPKQDYSSRFKHDSQRMRNYEFARVPSAHATLPKAIQESYKADFQQACISCDKKQEIVRSDPEVATAQRVQGDTNINKQNEVRTVNGLIIKNTPTLKSTPKFIPRQTLNITKTQIKPEKEDSVPSDIVKSELQRNAFVLGKRQGPELKVEGEKKMSTEEESVKNTVSQIRKRVQEVFEPSLYEKKQKQRKSDTEQPV